MFSSAVAMMPHVKAGKLRVIGTTAARRSTSQPEIPTVAEATGLKDYEAGSWYGVLAPAKTPRAVIARLATEAATALQSPDVRERLKAQGVDAVGNTPEKFAVYIKQEIVKWAKVMQAAGIHADAAP